MKGRNKIRAIQQNISTETGPSEGNDVDETGYEGREEMGHVDASDND